MVPYSIQWLKRLRPALFRQDLTALFELLHQQKIRPLIARRLPLAEARQAHELLGKGGVMSSAFGARVANAFGSAAASIGIVLSPEHGVEAAAAVDEPAEETAEETAAA